MKRIYHPWWKWECYPAGFYETTAPYGLTTDEARDMYRLFLSDLNWFEAGLIRVLSTWKHSCEHFLSNPSINRIAWLGQSSMHVSTGVPCVFCGGFRLLTDEQQAAANALADKYLTLWSKQ